MDITITWIDGRFSAYKAASYGAANWDAAAYKRLADNTAEWSGFYLAEKESVAEGYLPDMAKDGTGLAYINRVSVLDRVNVVVCRDESLKQGPPHTAELKMALRKCGLDILEDQLLIPRLGELGYFFKGYNNEEGDFEVIVPNGMVSCLAMFPHKQCTLRRFTPVCQSIAFLD